jgi:rubrerythrin
MFTFEDIREIALNIERNGEETYRRAARLCPDINIARLLTAMADDESRHYQWLATLSSARELSEKEQEMERMGRHLLEEMMAGNPFLPSSDDLAAAASLEEVLQRSRDFEEDTIVFYQFLLSLLEDAAAIKEMNNIIAEEGRHQRNLETMLDKNGDKLLAGLSC